MAPYEVGQVVQWTLRTYAARAAGRLGNLDNMPVATVTKPDGTTASASVANNSTGIYVATFTTTLPGRHRVRWTPYPGNPLATPTPIPADVSDDLPYTDIADVWPTDPRLIISLADARAALNTPDADRADDDELRLYVAATTAVIEDLTGPILSATRVETHDGDGSGALLLWDYPTAITSVVEEGVTLPASGYGLGRGGVLWRRGATWAARYPGNIVVTYTVGVTAPPANVVLAAREQLRHLWQVGQVATRPALGGEPAPGYTPMGFAVPNRVIELLGDHIGRYKPLGFA